MLQNYILHHIKANLKRSLQHKKGRGGERSLIVVIRMIIIA